MRNDPEFNQFIEVMDNLGEKLEPLLFQFGDLTGPFLYQ